MNPIYFSNKWHPVPFFFSPRPFSCCGFPATPSFRAAPSCGAWRIWGSGRRWGEDFMLEDLPPIWHGNLYRENNERPGYHTHTQTHRYTDTQTHRYKETKKQRKQRNKENKEHKERKEHEESKKTKKPTSKQKTGRAIKTWVSDSFKQFRP